MMVPTGVNFERSRQSHRDTALAQYTACADILNKIFRLCPDTSWQEDGIGCCSYYGTQDDDLKSLIFDWKALRIAKRTDSELPDWPDGTTNVCYYHKPNHGCCLEELKAPICLNFTMFSDSLPESFKRLGKISVFLKMVLEGTNDRSAFVDQEPDPERNWPMVQAWLTIAREVLADARLAYHKRTGCHALL